MSITKMKENTFHNAKLLILREKTWLTDDVAPQAIENVQQTPNPDAQAPAAVPLCTVNNY